MVTVSGSTKLWAFNLAEQMEKRNMLDALFTTYASSKNKFISHFVNRIDREEISTAKIHTNPILAIPMKVAPGYVHKWNDIFDQWVAGELKKSGSRVFIGWSGMSLHSIRKAKKKGMKTILERGSSHIVYQDKVLREEYRKFGKDFSIQPFVIQKELKEYDEADYIAIPSTFVKKTFIDAGIPSYKLLLNPYGFSRYFEQGNYNAEGKFIILYFGTISIRKGIHYLFEALSKMDLPENEWEVWFIGKIEEEMMENAGKYKARQNWKFFGHIDHYQLSGYVSKSSVAVFPSIEDGFGMVISQALACGIPTITTTHTGGPDIITDGENGYIIEPGNSAAIAEKLSNLFYNRSLLQSMHEKSAMSIQKGFTWDEYGERYAANIKQLLG